MTKFKISIPNNSKEGAMKEPDIFYGDDEIICSNCGNREVRTGETLKFFKSWPRYNNNIVNPNSFNSDMKYSLECLKCKKKTEYFPYTAKYLYF